MKEENGTATKWVPLWQRGGWWRLTWPLPVVLLFVMVWLAFEFAFGLIDGNRVRLGVGAIGLFVINVGGMFLHHKFGED